MEVVAGGYYFGNIREEIETIIDRALSVFGGMTKEVLIDKRLEFELANYFKAKEIYVRRPNPKSVKLAVPNSPEATIKTWNMLLEMKEYIDRKPVLTPIEYYAKYLVTIGLEAIAVQRKKYFPKGHEEVEKINTLWTSDSIESGPMSFTRAEGRKFWRVYYKGRPSPFEIKLRYLKSREDKGDFITFRAKRIDNPGQYKEVWAYKITIYEDYKPVEVFIGEVLDAGTEVKWTAPRNYKHPDEAVFIVQGDTISLGTVNITADTPLSEAITYDTSRSAVDYAYRKLLDLGFTGDREDIEGARVLQGRLFVRFKRKDIIEFKYEQWPMLTLVAKSIEVVPTRARVIVPSNLISRLILPPDFAL
ncbi:hypothetical protein [Pyrococcus kukulkanii]|uniref:Uncharacterized protein n=1 Tax=Pyrococcus kukulkanii TaxID=1609559 RepID=A0ABV4T5E2_9EURY